MIGRWLAGLAHRPAEPDPLVEFWRQRYDDTEAAYDRLGDYFGEATQASLKRELELLQRAERAEATVERMVKVATYWRDAARQNNPERNPHEIAVMHACATVLSAFDGPEVLNDLGLAAKEET